MSRPVFLLVCVTSVAETMLIRVKAFQLLRKVVRSRMTDKSWILYELRVTYPEQDAARAEEFLRQWADMF